MHENLTCYPSLAKKRVVVTGGGSGIGAEIVAAFAEQGAYVGFVDISREVSEALCDGLENLGLPRPFFCYCDISDMDALHGAMKELILRLGGVDILVNNAANDQRHRFEQVTPEEWDHYIAVNQRPLFFTCQAVVPYMRQQGTGVIINIGSISWHIKSAGYPVYATAKAAVSGLTRGLAKDLGRYGIRINTVTPGWVMTQRQLDMWVDDIAEEEIRRNQCLPTKLVPRDIANMVLFLTSNDSAMCTAQEFIVDGGWT